MSRILHVGEIWKDCERKAVQTSDIVRVVASRTMDAFAGSVEKMPPHGCCRHKAEDILRSLRSIIQPGSNVLSFRKKVGDINFITENSPVQREHLKFDECMVAQWVHFERQKVEYDNQSNPLSITDGHFCIQPEGIRELVNLTHRLCKIIIKGSTSEEEDRMKRRHREIGKIIVIDTISSAVEQSVCRLLKHGREVAQRVHGTDARERNETLFIEEAVLTCYKELQAEEILDRTFGSPSPKRIPR